MGEDQVVCWPWHLWQLTPGLLHPRGANCAYCRRDVAVRPEEKGQPVCLYCALDRGLIPAEERPLGERDDFGRRDPGNAPPPLEERG